MKREYSKPTIHVEEISVDMPIASACQSYYEVPELRAQGWFIGEDVKCKIILGHHGDKNADDNWSFGGDGDSFCYHSHAQTTFNS